MFRGFYLPSLHRVSLCVLHFRGQTFQRPIGVYLLHTTDRPQGDISALIFSFILDIKITLKENQGKSEEYYY